MVVQEGKAPIRSSHQGWCLGTYVCVVLSPTADSFSDKPYRVRSEFVKICHQAFSIKCHISILDFASYIRLVVFHKSF